MQIVSEGLSKIGIKSTRKNERCVFLYSRSRDAKAFLIWCKSAGPLKWRELHPCMLTASQKRMSFSSWVKENSPCSSARMSPGFVLWPKSMSGKNRWVFFWTFLKDDSKGIFLNWCEWDQRWCQDKAPDKLVKWTVNPRRFCSDQDGKVPMLMSIRFGLPEQLPSPQIYGTASLLQVPAWGLCSCLQFCHPELEGFTEALTVVKFSYPFLLCFVLVITEQAMVMLCTCHNRLSEQCFPILLTGKWRQKKSEWDKSLVVSAPACAELAACSLRPALAGCRAPPSQPPLPRAPQSAPVRELTRRYSPSSSPLKHSVISINIKNPVTT